MRQEINVVRKVRADNTLIPDPYNRLMQVRSVPRLKSTLMGKLSPFCHGIVPAVHLLSCFPDLENEALLQELAAGLDVATEPFSNFSRMERPLHGRLWSL